MQDIFCFYKVQVFSAFHQGRAVTVRSEKSIIEEAESFLDNPRFKGYISDVGGPTANFRLPSCEKQKTVPRLYRVRRQDFHNTLDTNAHTAENRHNQAVLCQAAASEDSAQEYTFRAFE